MTKKTIRLIKDMKENIDKMKWVEIFESQLMNREEIQEIIEINFEKEEKELKESRLKTDDWHEKHSLTRDLDIKKSEWFREYIRNFSL